MNAFVLLATLATIANARPDVGINYLPPGGGSHHTGGFSHSGGGGGGNFGFGGSSGFRSQQSFGGGASFGHGGGGFQRNQQEVTNTVYFYDAPQDELIQAATVRVDGGAGSQHNRVVFIKAPGYQTQQIQDVSGNVAGSGEKTKIYVLAKRPEAQQDVIINTASHSSVAKPEVYYIKYNTQQDAEEQILGSLHGQSNAGAAQSVDSDHAFVNTIRDVVDVRSGGPLVHNLGGGGGSTVEAGATILGLSGAHFTNGESSGAHGGGGSFITKSGSSSSFVTSGGSTGGHEAYTYNKPN